MYTSCGFQSNLQVQSSLAREVTVNSEVVTNSRTLNTLNVVSNKIQTLMLLFDDIKRTYEGYALHNESTYDYYQQSARKDISTIRNILNEWFQSYPNDEKKELKNSFVDHFDNCFVELFYFNFSKNLTFRLKGIQS